MRTQIPYSLGYEIYLTEQDVIRFWSKVVKTPTCWLWAAATQDGYGRFWVRSVSNNVPAHRLAYELEVGNVPVDLQLDHLCRVRHCVNPSHMEIVTCAENLKRGNTTNAYGHSRTECTQGHPIIRVGPCRECNRLKLQVYNRTYERKSRGARR